MELTPISTIIEKIMDIKGFTQQEFADYYRFDKAQVSRWLNKDQQPRGEVYLRLRMEYDKLVHSNDQMAS